MSDIESPCMAEPGPTPPIHPSSPTERAPFAEPASERGFPTVAVAIAAAAVAILLVVLALMSRRPAAPGAAANTLQPPAAYASNLAIGGIQMSEADSISGGKSIYIDGHIANHGQATVTGITVQVIFANSEALPPQLETLPLSLVYMREPYIDTRPVSAAAPLGPGAEADFRLIFDDINDNWNQQPPTIRVIRVSTR